MCFRVASPKQKKWLKGCWLWGSISNDPFTSRRPSWANYCKSAIWISFLFDIADCFKLISSAVSLWGLWYFLQKCLGFLLKKWSAPNSTTKRCPKKKSLSWCSLFQPWSFTEIDVETSTSIDPKTTHPKTQNQLSPATYGGNNRPVTGHQWPNAANEPPFLGFLDQMLPVKWIRLGRNSCIFSKLFRNFL